MKLLAWHADLPHDKKSIFGIFVGSKMISKNRKLSDLVTGSGVHGFRVTSSELRDQDFGLRSRLQAQELWVYGSRLRVTPYGVKVTGLGLRTVGCGFGVMGESGGFICAGSKKYKDTKEDIK